MLKFTRFLALFLLLAAFAPLYAPARAASLPGMEAPKKEVSVNADDLKNLITTLESETSRTELITNLKTLLDAQGKDETPVEETIAPLTQKLGVASFAENAIHHYEDFLARNDLTGSMVGKIASTVLVTIFGAGIVFAMRRAATRLLYWIDRAVTWIDLPAARLRLYARFVRSIVTIGLMGLMLYTYTLIWNFNGEGNIFESKWFRDGLGLAINLVFVVIMATAVWEAINATLQLTLRKTSTNGASRAQTIVPIVRNVLFLVFALLFALVLLSELGINIVPLLAGAGIVGVAIGFGAQTMVKDFLSGFTIILEDIVRVGDVVNMAGLAGVVEKITLRKIQLRAYDGTVHTIPYSEITTIQNMTKDFSMYAMEVRVDYHDDTDNAVSIMRAVSSQMRTEADFSDKILEDIDIAGVDRFADFGVIIKARIKTIPGQQWPVGREYNRRLKKAFDEQGIEIPLPQQVTWNRNPPVTVVQQHPGHAPDIDHKISRTTD